MKVGLLKRKFLKEFGFIFVLGLLVSLPLYAADDAATIPGGFTSGNARDDKAYVIGSTNLIHIKVLGEDGQQQTFRVDESGFITHPLLSRVKIGGKTVSEAEDMIRNMLAGGYILNPNVTIFVVEHSRFSILGGLEIMKF